MNRNDLPADLHLSHRAIFSIAVAAGVDVACREGSLWITLDNDTRDIVIEAGERFSTEEHRRAVIYAMEPSDLTVGFVTRYSKNSTMETLSRFHAMPLTNAAR